LAGSVVIVAAIGLKITRLRLGKIESICKKFVDVLARLYCDTLYQWSIGVIKNSQNFGQQRK